MNEENKNGKVFYYLKNDTIERGVFDLCQKGSLISMKNKTWTTNIINMNKKVLFDL